MPKSRIFLFVLGAFLSGIVAAKFVVMPGWVIWSSLALLFGLLMLFDDHLVKIVVLWAGSFVFGIGYPLLLGREHLITFSLAPAIADVFNHIRDSFLQSVNNVFPEPYGTFAQGLTIGERSELPKSLKQAFISTGTLHIIAVSGFNFTILIRLFHDFIRGFGRKRSFILGTAAIIGFIIITGLQPSVIRAGIMGWLFLLASALGRLPNITNALFLTAVLMVLQEPAILTDSLNFQLSFLSMLGLIWIEPLVTASLNKTGWQRYVPAAFRAGLAATLGAQIMTMGLTLSVFGRLSLISPLVNMLIAPFVPYAMMLALAAGVATMLYLPLGMLVAFPAWLFLKIILTLITFFASIRFAAVGLHPWPWWWAVGYYAIILFVVWYAYENKKIVAIKT